MSTVRQASHCGSWYTDNVTKLNRQLDQWLEAVDVVHRPAKAIISPHAGYDYCGSCAAFAYRQIDPQLVDRVFVLGPSHHVHLSGCALTNCDFYQTPFYDLTIDKQMCQQLHATGAFERMSRKTDEDEHSIEMQLPLLAKVMKPRGENKFAVVPILVGALSAQAEREYGRILAPYLAQPRTLFVISSDFCHWGDRFSYTHYDQSWGREIWQSIDRLDHLGMEIIESASHDKFVQYLSTYRNTICGRHPIGVLLAALNELSSNGKPNGLQNGFTGQAHAGDSGLQASGAGAGVDSSALRFSNAMSIRFLNYKQSSHVMNLSDSSVSYAAASLAL